MGTQFDDTHQNQAEQVRLLAQLADFPLKIDTIALAPDGSSLAIAAAGLGISIWNLESSIQQSVLEIPEEVFRQSDPAFIRDMASWVPLMVHSLTFSNDGVFMAAAFTNQEVEIWLAEGTLLETIKCSAVDLVFLPQTPFLVLCREDGRIEVWETMPIRLLTAFETLAELASVSLSQKKLSRCRIACSRDGKQLAVIATFSDLLSICSHIFMWNIAHDNGSLRPILQRTFPGPPDYINKVGYLQSDHFLFCSSLSGSLWEIDTDTGTSTKLSPVEETFWPALCCSSMSPDRKFVALADRYGMVLIWDISKQCIVLQFQAHKEVKASIDAISAMVWLPDGKQLITIGTSRAGDDQVKRSETHLPPSFKHNTIKIWRIEV